MSRFYLHGKNKTKKNALYLSVNVFSTKVLYGDNVFLCKIYPEKLFGEVQERKWRLFKTIIKLKTLQNSHFSKGVSPWFLSKNWHFSNYCFYAEWIEKKSMKKFLKQNENLFRLQKHRFKTAAKFSFPKGYSSWF